MLWASTAVRGIGNHAAEVWRGMEYVGLISKSKTSGRWCATHNCTLSDSDLRFRFSTPKAAALSYYMQLPDVAKDYIIAALKEG